MIFVAKHLRCVLNNLTLKIYWWLADFKIIVSWQVLTYYSKPWIHTKWQQYCMVRMLVESNNRLFYGTKYPLLGMCLLGLEWWHLLKQMLYVVAALRRLPVSLTRSLEYLITLAPSLMMLPISKSQKCSIIGMEQKHNWKWSVLFYNWKVTPPD